MRPVPSLELPHGKYIGQAAAIMEYFEDICDNPQEQWQKEIAALAKYTMRGHDSLERVEIRGILSLIEEASVLFSFAALRGTKRHRAGDPLNCTIAQMMLKSTKKSLEGIQGYYFKRFKENFDDHDYGGDINIADIALFALLEFAQEFHGQNLVPDLLSLKGFYTAFSARKSAQRPQGFYPADIMLFAHDWS
ncbi:hypothetical protein F4805DRAFT_473041 [Annulohypoxylon moriforme]|nr:hypothetical protein F4805DRAFT_473041 [Annulohypoxylon moriforme]